MKEKKYIDFTTEDFFLDDSFREWVIKDTPDNFWTVFREEHPEKEEEIEKTRLIIRSLIPVQPDIEDHRLQAIYKKIKPQKETRTFKYWTRIAAGLAIFLIAGTLSWTLFFQEFFFSSFPENGIATERGRIILADGSVTEFDAKKTVIKQIESGSLIIDDDTLKMVAEQHKSTRETMNQIMIPYGKRSEITLSDGTHIWLNSGSSLSYPSVFNADEREVFLSGEAFFEVSVDKSRPFYVTAKDFRVKVLGTKFNVSAYAEDSIARTVLLEGKVTASKNKLFAREVHLMPGEEVVFNREQSQVETRKVDVWLYSSWIKGYLIFRNESIGEVFKKLERYYNQKIEFDGKQTTRSFSGKLDLSDNIDAVLENISFTSSLTVCKRGNTYIVK